MIPRFCECGHDNTINGTGHCRVHHKDYPVLNGGEGCPDCKAERKPLEDRFDELARQLKTVEQKGMEYLRVENEQLRARITELTQCDPSWYDMSVADAFRLWKAEREELERIRAEVERLKGENADLLAALQIVKEQRQTWWGKAVQRGGETRKLQSALTHCRNEALEEAARVAGGDSKYGRENEYWKGRYDAEDAIRALKTSSPREGEEESCEWTPHSTLPDMMTTSCGGVVDKLAMSMSWGCGYCGKPIRAKE